MRLVLWLILLSFSSCLFSQTLDDIGKIVVGVKVLPNSSVETKNNKDFLKNKLINLATQAGFSSYGNSTFLMVPAISVHNVQNAEGGMKNIYVINGELYLTIQENDAGTVFSSESFAFRGSGVSKEAALKNGIQNISYGNMKPFFDEAKSKILDYYSAMQDKIFANADMLVKNKDFDAAISCLLSIPEDLFDLYEKAFSKACQIYQERDEYIAEQRAIKKREDNNAVLVKARSFLSCHDATGAMKVLWAYSMSGTEQDNEYYNLLTKAEAIITSEEQALLAKEQQEYEERRLKEERDYADSKQEYADKMNYMNRQLELENKKADNQKEMVQAVKAVALEYMKSKMVNN